MPIIVSYLKINIITWTPVRTIVSVVIILVNFVMIFNQNILLFQIICNNFTYQNFMVPYITFYHSHKPTTANIVFIYIYRSGENFQLLILYLMLKIVNRKKNRFWISILCILLNFTRGQIEQIVRNKNDVTLNHCFNIKVSYHLFTYSWKS